MMTNNMGDVCSTLPNDAGSLPCFRSEINFLNFSSFLSQRFLITTFLAAWTNRLIVLYRCLHTFSAWRSNKGFSATSSFPASVLVLLLQVAVCVLTSSSFSIGIWYLCYMCGK